MNTLIKQICKFNYSPLSPTNHLIDFHRKILLPTVYELLKSSVLCRPELKSIVTVRSKIVITLQFLVKYLKYA